MDDQLKQEMLRAFDEIQMFRTPFALQNLVVGAHHTEPHRYAQCVLEMSRAYDGLRLAELESQKKELEIAQLPDTPIGEIDRQIKEIELEQIRRAVLGKSREFEALFTIWRTFGKQYTRADIDASSEEEYRKRLLTQARQDLLAMGRIGQGNQEGLRQTGLSTLIPAADPTNIIAETVEQRYLSTGKTRILVAVPTLEKSVKGLPCLKNVSLPGWAETKLLNFYGHPIAEAYEIIAEQSLVDGADYLVTVEDDVFPPPDAIVRLIEWCRDENRSRMVAVGAWYPKRSIPREGAHIVVKEIGRDSMVDDGTIQVAHTLAMGCSVFPTKMFGTIPRPWFQTTSRLTQDSYFSQIARDAGWTLLVDTSIKCRHVDRETGQEYT